MSEKRLKTGVYGQVYDAHGMFHTLGLQLEQARMYNAIRAMAYMWDMHTKSQREDGQLYAVHPMKMALKLMALQSAYPRYITEETIIVALLHDVTEEEWIPVSDLPFTEQVQASVERMTIRPLKGETVYARRVRAASAISVDRNVALVRPVDRIDNLSTMKGVLSDKRVRKNIVETDQLILPELTKVKEASQDDRFAWLLGYLIDELKMVRNILALDYRVKLTDPDFVNPPDAEDCTALLY